MIAIDMEMPERCLDCLLNTCDMKCPVTGNTTFDDIMRPRWCPLHEFQRDSDGSIKIYSD